MYVELLKTKNCLGVLLDVLVLLVVSSLCLISLGLFYIPVEGLPSNKDFDFQFMLTQSFSSVDRDV